MAAQNPNVAPNQTEYGGDEISALVLDPGYSSTRAGFAGEDAPKSVVPTFYGTVPGDSKKTNIFGDNSIHNPFPNFTIKNPMASDGTVEDWDAAANLWEYSITSRLTNPRPQNPMSNGLNSHKGDEVLAGEDADMTGVEDQERPCEENPLLMTETGWNTGKGREKPIEIAMETLGCPAFWMARSGVLGAFANGKPSALVVDVGASGTSVTPVHDGLLLKKGVMRSPLGGNYISTQSRLLLSQNQSSPITLIPHYLITSKTPVDAGSPAQAAYRTFTPDTTPDPSFRALQEERLLGEFKESVVQVWTQPGRLLAHGPSGIPNEELAKQQPGRPFEFPDGYNQVFGSERFRPAEALFDPKAALTDASNPTPEAKQTLPAIIQASLNAVDVDIRPLLLANIVVVGGSSLMYGFVERLDAEVKAMFAGARVRVSAAGNLYERKFAGWIGGSITASLGTFHQMWISKKEYEEHGAGIVEKRCK
ncbi:NuA4 histone acetyltransferase subunit [Agyrium rufum]|nr:NuA4 histone acetyltransferase subunit [Agyrium rufum]